MSKVQITVTSVLADLANGLTRLKIQEKYNLSGVELKSLFQHPKLKNKKVHKIKELGFELIDDTETQTVALAGGEEIVLETTEVEETTVESGVIENAGWTS